MPFDPATTFGPGNPAGSDGIDDWFVPTSARTDTSFPDDWIYRPAAASTAPPAPSAQPDAASPGISNRSAAPPDPYAAYWSLIPASRAGAMAWHPPIFLSPNPSSPENGVAAQGLLGGIAKLQQANGLIPYQPGIPDVGTDPTDAVDALSTFQATPNGLTDPGASSSSPEGSLILPSFGAGQSTLDLGPTATNAAYIYPSPLDQILPCFVSSIGCAGGGGGNRGGGGGGGWTAPRPSLPSPPRGSPPAPRPTPSGAPRAPAPGPRSSSPSAPGTSTPELNPIGEPPAPAEADAGARDIAPPAPISGEDRPTPSAPEWRQYEQDKGSQQTTRRTTFRGKDITVRLDFPPDENGIVDLKKYNWWKPGYMRPFLQGKVTEKFQIQIQKYQTLDPRVQFKFSAQPPPWVVQALEQVGGTYIVEP